MDTALESKEEDKPANPSDGIFELLPSRLFTFSGPLTKCLEEDDEILYDADRFVPNGTTIRIKVYLPNKKPLFVVVKKDATVQDTIEMTIRKSNALAAAFRKEYTTLTRPHWSARRWTHHWTRHWTHHWTHHWIDRWIDRRRHGMTAWTS